MIDKQGPFRRANPPPVPDDEEDEYEYEDDTQAARAILALAVERYQYEHGRTKDIESKAGTTLGLTGAILVLATGRLNRDAAPCLDGRDLMIYYILVAIGMVFLVAAAVSLLFALQVQEHQYFNLRLWVRRSQTSRPLSETRGLLEVMAASYRDYTELNMEINQGKAEWYARSGALLLGGVLVIVSAAMWASCVLPRIW